MWRCFLLFSTQLLVYFGPCVLFVDTESDRFHAAYTAYDISQKLWNQKTSFSVKGCKPVQFILYARHGSRYPGKKAIRLMNLHLPKLKTILLRNKKLKFLKTLINSWNVQYDSTSHHLLSEPGRQEIFDIARRWKKRFPNLFTDRYSKTIHEFRSTRKQRTEHTAIHFARGIFNNEDFDSFELPASLEHDHLLRFYKGCKKWIKEVDKSEEAHVEEQKFLQSKVYADMLKRVGQKLSGDSNFQLTHDELSSVYSACVFDYIVNVNRSSPLCSLLSSKDRRLLEYWHDLEHYWTDGYAHSLTYKQACRPVADVIDNFRMVVNGTSTKKAILRFSHLGLLLKLYARFGLFKDSVNLTSDMMNLDQTTNFSVHDRQYRMSKIGPMATNIAFVLYKCDDTGRYKLKAYVQEKEVAISGCPNHICDLKRFVGIYGPVVDGCNVEQMCLV